MDDLLKHSWWSLLLMGLAAVAFGVVVFAWPGISLVALVVLFGAFVLAYGLCAVIASLGNRKHYERWWLLLLAGLASIVVGVATLAWPGLTALALLYLIGAWAVVAGVIQFAAAIRLRKKIRREWLLVLSGIANVIFGILLFVVPAAGALAILWLIATFAMIIGILLIIQAFQVRRRHKAIDRLIA